jgi:hypothetical protein
MQHTIVVQNACEIFIPPYVLFPVNVPVTQNISFLLNTSPKPWIDFPGNDFQISPCGQCMDVSLDSRSVFVLRTNLLHFMI